MKRLSLFIAILLVTIAQANPPAPSRTQEPIGKPIRIKTNAKGDIAGLEVMTARYKRGNVTVDVIGTVHVADKPYYDAINRYLNGYEVVLYELVAPNGTVPEQNKRQGGMMRMVANMILGLEHQMAAVDYSGKHFVHADMSKEELQEAMAKNGDSFITMALESVLNMMRQNNKAAYEAKKNPFAKPAQKMPDIDIQALLMGDPNESNKIKRMMAKQFDSAEDISTSLGSTVSTYIINDRNIAALKVLEEQVKLGKKSMALYYGAGHIPDFDKRLLRMGFVRTHTRWDLAWAGLDTVHRFSQEDRMNRMIQKLLSNGGR